MVREGKGNKAFSILYKYIFEIPHSSHSVPMCLYIMSVLQYSQIYHHEK